MQTGKAASLPMVDAILVIVNGHFFTGVGKLVKAFTQNLRSTRRLAREFAATSNRTPGSPPVAVK
jgi:beta-glucosidase